MEIVNELMKKWEIKEQDIIHWDILRKELFDSLSSDEQKELFPKMYKVFSWEEKGIDLIQRIWIEEYLRLEREESKVVFDRKIKPIIGWMNAQTKKVVVWVQLLPELINEATKWKELWLDSLIVNTAEDFRNKILSILDIITKK
jgi:hypothetical protein